MRGIRELAKALLSTPTWDRRESLYRVPSDISGGRGPLLDQVDVCRSGCPLRDLERQLKRHSSERVMSKGPSRRTFPSRQNSEVVASDMTSSSKPSRTRVIHPPAFQAEEIPDASPPASRLVFDQAWRTARELTRWRCARCIPRENSR